MLFCSCFKQPTFLESLEPKRLGAREPVGVVQVECLQTECPSCCSVSKRQRQCSAYTRLMEENGWHQVGYLLAVHGTVVTRAYLRMTSIWHAGVEAHRWICVDLSFLTQTLMHVTVHFACTNATIFYRLTRIYTHTHADDIDRSWNFFHFSM